MKRLMMVVSVYLAVLLCLGAWFILKGELTPGMLLASQGFMSAMLYPITKMSNVMQDVFKAHSVLERQEEILDVECQSWREEEEVHKLATADDSDIITVHMADKYGDQGLVAVLILKYEQDVYEERKEVGAVGTFAGLRYDT